MVVGRLCGGFGTGWGLGGVSTSPPLAEGHGSSSQYHHDIEPPASANKSPNAQSPSPLGRDHQPGRELVQAAASSKGEDAPILPRSRSLWVECSSVRVTV